MSSITLRLSPDTERKLREKADRVGLTLEGYLGQLAETDVASGASDRTATFDERVASIRQAFQESGMTDADLAELVEEAREEVWREKEARKSP